MSSNYFGNIPLRALLNGRSAKHVRLEPIPEPVGMLLKEGIDHLRVNQNRYQQANAHKAGIPTRDGARKMQESFEKNQKRQVYEVQGVGAMPRPAGHALVSVGYRIGGAVQDDPDENGYDDAED